MKQANLLLTILYFIGSVIVMIVFSAVLSTTSTINIRDHILNIVILIIVSVFITAIFHLVNPSVLIKIKDLLDGNYNDSSVKRAHLLVTYPFRIIPSLIITWLLGMTVYLCAGNFTTIIEVNNMPVGFLFSCIFVFTFGIISQMYSFKIATNIYVSKMIKKLGILELSSVYIPIRYKLISILCAIIVSAYLILLYGTYNQANTYIHENLYSDTLQAVSHIAGIINKSSDPDVELKDLSNKFKGTYNIYLYNLRDKTIKSYSNIQMGMDTVKQFYSRNVVQDKRNDQTLLLLNKPITINNNNYYRLMVGINKNLYRTPLTGFLYNLLLSGVFILIIVLITGILISYDLSSHEKSLSEYSVKLSNKELTQMPEIVSTDELGLILNNMRMLAANFKESKFRMSADIDSMNGILTSTYGSIAKVKSTVSEQSKFTDELIGIINSIGDVSKQIIKTSTPLNETTVNNSRSIAQALQKNKEMAHRINNASGQIARASRLLLSNIDTYEDIRSNIIKLKDTISSVKKASGSVNSKSSDINALLGRFLGSIDAVKALNTKSMEFNSDIEAILGEIINITDSVLSLLSTFLTHIQQADEMLSIINNIAERTNLLSVNAYILAASPQTEGRNFRVVAEEIKKLAERARTGSKNISNYITKVRRNVDTIFLNMKDMNNFILLTKQSFYSMSLIETRIQDLSVSTINNISINAKPGSSGDNDKNPAGTPMMVADNFIQALIEDTSSAVTILSELNNIFTELKSSFVRMSEINSANNVSLTAINHSLENIKAFTGYINDSLAIDVNNQILFSADSAKELNSHIKSNEQTIDDLEGIINKLVAELELLDKATKLFIA